MGRPCEARVDWSQNDDGGYEPVFCESTETTEYTDIWGGTRAFCSDRTHEVRVKSFYPEKIQRMLYEDFQHQAAAMGGRDKVVGGGIRPGAPVYDEAERKRLEKETE